MVLSKQVLDATQEDAAFARLFDAGELIAPGPRSDGLRSGGEDAYPADAPPPWKAQGMPAATFGRFLLAGNATFTVVSRKTGTRFTFKVQASKPSPQYPTPLHFVKVLTGAENETSYTYLGQIVRRGGALSYMHGRKSSITASAPSALAFAWFAGHVLQGQDVPGVDVYHAGKCGRCGRTLTVPESITSSFGPECIGLVGG